MIRTQSAQATCERPSVIRTTNRSIELPTSRGTKAAVMGFQGAETAGEVVSKQDSQVEAEELLCPMTWETGMIRATVSSKRM